MNGIKRLLAATCMCIVATSAHTERAHADPVQPAPVSESPAKSAERAVIRVNANGSFVGTGVIVSESGCVVASSETAGAWRYAAFTLGDGHVPAKVVTIDAPHKLALICASASVGTPAALSATRAAKNTPLSVAGIRTLRSDPPMIERFRISARVVTPTYNGESSGELDLRDLIVARQPDDGSSEKLVGHPAFNAKTGAVEGVVIGKLSRSGGSDDILIIPASTIADFLKAQRLTFVTK